MWEIVLRFQGGKISHDSKSENKNRMRSSLSAAIAAIQKHLSCKPRLHHSSFIARGATVLGNVQLGEDSSVWYNSVLRGDINSITIGCRSNVQDGAVIHVGSIVK